MMAEKMPMPLNNCVQCALGKLIDELRHFIIKTDTFLRGGFFPNAKGIICIALISNMTEQHNSIYSFLPQFFALPDYMRIIRQELNFWKFSFQILTLRCLNSYQPYHSYLYSRLHSVYLSLCEFLQKVGLLIIAYFQVGQHVFQMVTFFQIFMKKFWALIELVISYGCAIDFQDVEEVIHDVALADKSGGFKSAFELVTSIQVEHVSCKLLPDCGDHLPHELQSTEFIGLVGQFVLDLSGKCLAVDVVCSDDCDSLKVLVRGTAKKEKREEQQDVVNTDHYIQERQGQLQPFSLEIIVMSFNIWQFIQSDRLFQQRVLLKIASK